MYAKYSSFFDVFVEVTTHQDDEYSWAGVEDPKVVVTTSHNPSSRLKQFSKVSYVKSPRQSIDNECE